MKIISPFKDYYDWVAGKYGGGDPRLIYNRNRIKGTSMSDPGFGLNRLASTELHRQRQSQQKPTHQLELLIFCGRRYVVVRNWERFGDADILSEARHPELYSVMMEKPRTYEVFRSQWDPQKMYLGGESQLAIDLCKKYSQPVLLISGDPTPTVRDRIPILRDLGFGSIMPAEQCYQEISHFLGNVLCDSPDTKPPVEVDDKFKIIGAGFDTKTSFRHRK